MNKSSLPRSGKSRNPNNAPRTRRGISASSKKRTASRKTQSTRKPTAIKSIVRQTPTKQVSKRKVPVREGERLERYLAHAGISSRREAKDLIMRGLVKVNGHAVRNPGFGVTPGTDVIVIKDGAIASKKSVLLYKPRGLETTATREGVADIRSKFPHYAHLSPIGRLDKESEGLILLSNDGTLARSLTGENSHVEKEYLVTTRELVSPIAVEKMSRGIMIDKIRTKPAIVDRKSRTTFTIILREGRKHQIRRMCAACSLTIESLVRIRIGHLRAGSMKPGNTRPISQEEIEFLKK